MANEETVDSATERFNQLREATAPKENQDQGLTLSEEEKARLRQKYSALGRHKERRG